MIPAGNIVLCGFMGCGKSTVGRRLAAMTGRPFVDMDDYIAQKEGRPVREIFALFGEEGFRLRESRAAAELAARTGLVIASGGGTVLDAGNAALLRGSGRLLLLDTPPACIRRRLRGDVTRPLLQKGPAAVETLYRERMPVYRAAAHGVIAVGPADSPEQVASRILRWLEDH